MKSKVPNKKAKLDAAAKLESKLASSSKSTLQSPTELLAVAKMKAAVVAAASSSTNLSAAAASVQEHPSYPIFAILDLTKEFPRMANVLTGGTAPAVPSPNVTTSTTNEATGTSSLIPIEDIDLIQVELETLWSSVSIRMRTLERERELLQFAISSHTYPPNSTAGLLEHYDLNHQEKINAVKSIIDSGHGTRTSVSAAAALVLGVTTPNATSAVVAAASISTPVLVGSNRKSNNSIAAAIKLEKQPKKKLKGDSIGGKRASNTGVGSLPANRFTQNRSHSLSLDDCHAEAPNQFWQFSDSYCRDITVENLDTLEKLVEESRKELPPSIFEVPPLGKHFLEQEEFAGARKKGRPEKKEIDNDFCGPLTQRLVAALVEDRVALFNSIQANESATTNGAITNGITEYQGTFMKRPGLATALGLDVIGKPATNGGSLESRLKQVLLEQGLLLADESAQDPDLPEDDDILAEIKRTEASLRNLHQHNKEKLENLYKMGKDAQEKIGLKEELGKADREVLESYKLVHTSRVKKKPITKKERDTAFRGLNNRMAALEKLGSIPQSLKK